MMKREPYWAENSRAVLISVSDYRDAGFPNIPGARNSLNAMRDLLADSTLCEWPSNRISVIDNPSSISDLGADIADLTEQITGVFLLYYVGHGVLSPQGKLCLTVSSSRSERPQLSSLAWDTVADILRDCQAKVRLVVLDCCFAGQAIEALSSAAPQGLADIAHVDGVYTLTATMRNKTAHVPPFHEQVTACTSFTGELCGLIQNGLPEKGDLLTLNDIFPALRQRLQAKGLPTPNQRGTGTAHLFQFSLNASRSHTFAASENARIIDSVSGVEQESSGGKNMGNKIRAARLLDQALQAAYSITSPSGPPSQTLAIASVAATMIAFNPRRAEMLFADAKRIARSTSGTYKVKCLLDIAAVLDGVDSNHAADLIKEAEAESDKDPVSLGLILNATSEAKPDNITKLIVNADRSIKLISDRRSQLSKWREFVKVLAPLDPNRALLVAQDMSAGSAEENYFREQAYLSIVQSLTSSDPDKAELIARKVNSMRASALECIALSLIPEDLDRAERIVRSIDSGVKNNRALYLLAKAIASVDQNRAAELISEVDERFGRTTDGEAAALALAQLGVELFQSDPDRAAMYLSDAERAVELSRRKISRSTAESTRSNDLLELVKTIVHVDLERAERIANKIDGHRARCQALVQVTVELISGLPLSADSELKNSDIG